MEIKENFDLVVIGSGPGGYTAAIYAAKSGLKTAIIEKRHIGGVCLNVGCIPTKFLLNTAHVYSFINKKKKNMGFIFDNMGIDYPTLVGQSRKMVGRLCKGIEHLLKHSGVTIFTGSASIESKEEIIIKSEEKEEKISAKNIIVATGSRPFQIPNIPIDGEVILTSREAIVGTRLPESVIIVGGGAIGVEFAYVYNSFGSKVTIVEMMDQILPGADQDAVKELTKALKKQKIKIITSAKVEESKVDGNKAITKITKDGKTTEHETDMVLISIGVKPNTENIGLEKVGIELDQRKFIKVDENYKTNIDNIYAIGDVMGKSLYAHTAVAEGKAAVETILGNPKTVDYGKIPACVYSEPQFATIGMTEAQAKEKNIPVKICNVPMRACGKAVALDQPDGICKLIYHEENGKLLGAHIVGPNVTELLGELNIIMTGELDYKVIENAIHPHPTISEILPESTESIFSKSIHI